VSRENVEIARRIYDAVAQRDAATPFAYYAEDIVWDVSNSRRATLMMHSVYHGHEGVRQCWREAVEAFGEVDFDVEELIDAGGQVVIHAGQREDHLGWPRYLVDQERFSTSLKPSTIAQAQGCRIESALPTDQAYAVSEGGLG
jgi:ketosteroid isomerase-like protein